MSKQNMQNAIDLLSERPCGARVLETVAVQPKHSVRNVLKRFGDDMQAIIIRSDLQERKKVTLYSQILDRYNDIDEKRVAVVNDGSDDLNKTRQRNEKHRREVSKSNLLTASRKR